MLNIDRWWIYKHVNYVRSTYSRLTVHQVWNFRFLSFCNYKLGQMDAVQRLGLLRLLVWWPLTQNNFGCHMNAEAKNGFSKLRAVITGYRTVRSAGRSAIIYISIAYTCSFDKMFYIGLSYNGYSLLAPVACLQQPNTTAYVLIQ